MLQNHIPNASPLVLSFQCEDVVQCYDVHAFAVHLESHIQNKRILPMSEESSRNTFSASRCSNEKKATTPSSVRRLEFRGSRYDCVLWYVLQYWLKTATSVGSSAVRVESIARLPKRLTGESRLLFGWKETLRFFDGKALKGSAKNGAILREYSLHFSRFVQILR